jgi:hypothetical protein
MSAFTDRLYRSWAAQNGYSGPRTRDVRGMGGVPPMMTQNMRTDPVPPRVFESAGYANPSCHDKQKTPASVTNTPEVMTNIRTRNDDGTNCRS